MAGNVRKGVCLLNYAGIRCPPAPYEAFRLCRWSAACGGVPAKGLRRGTASVELSACL